MSEEDRARIRALEPGPELDALVARRVFGLTPCGEWVRMNFGSAGGPALAKRCDHPNGACYSTVVVGSIHGHVGGPPAYSTNLGVAWLVVEKLREIGLGFIAGTEKDGWEIEILTTEELYQRGYRGLYFYSKDFPLAVCRAALLAMAEVER